MKLPTTRQVLESSPLTDPKLARRLANCGRPATWGWSYCRTYGCQRCRKFRVQDWIDKALAAFHGSRKGNLRFVTIMLSPVSGVDEIKPAINRARIAIRNTIYQLRRSDSRAANISMVGAVEVDWYHNHHIERLSSSKRHQIETLGFDKTESGIWFPHFHLVVDLSDFPERIFVDRLQRKWSGPRQVDSRCLDPRKTKSENIAALLTYATKHDRLYEIDPFRGGNSIPWPNHVTVQLHNAVFKSGGYSMIRFSLKPMKSHDDNADVYNSNEEDEAMPMIIY